MLSSFLKEKGAGKDIVGKERMGRKLVKQTRSFIPPRTNNDKQYQQTSTKKSHDH
jgi:hypothetical protein